MEKSKIDGLVCIIPYDVLENIKSLILYSFENEQAHFEATYEVFQGEDGRWFDPETNNEVDISKFKEHVFHKVLKIDAFIKGLDKPNKTNPFTKEDWVKILETAKRALTDVTTIEIMAEDMGVDESELFVLGSRLERYLDD
jgi:hypothetical protein